MTADIIPLSRPRAAIERLADTVKNGRPFRPSMTPDERRFMEDLEALLGWAAELEKKVYPAKEDDDESE